MRLKSQLIMSAEDIQTLSELPANMSDNKLTAKQIRQVEDIYHKYIGEHLDNIDLSGPLWEQDRKHEPNWPSGPRMKRHEAKRIVLNWLMSEQKHMTDSTEQLAKHFLMVCRCRPVYVQFIGKAWTEYPES